MAIFKCFGKIKNPNPYFFGSGLNEEIECSYSLIAAALEADIRKVLEIPGPKGDSEEKQEEKE